MTSIDFDFSKRLYDMNNGMVSGGCNENINEGLIFVINDESGRNQYSGIAKNIKTSQGNATFKIDDFRRIFDTEVLLDFTDSENLDFTVEGIFTKVFDRVINSFDPIFSEFNISYAIPSDTRNTKTICDYTGQYLVVNALKFLKVYLSFYNYYISSNYDAETDTIHFYLSSINFVPVEIKLKDFIYEQATQDISVNKTIATIQFDSGEGGVEWLASDSTYYFLQDVSNRANHTSNMLPDPSGFPPGFALLMGSGRSWVSSNQSEYNSSHTKKTELVKIVECPASSPSEADALTNVPNAENYEDGTVFRIIYGVVDNEGIFQDCGYVFYFKCVMSDATYYKIGEYSYTKRPNLPTKVYTLGNDNQIYEGYAPNDKRMFPVISRTFEGQYLSESQFNAVYELVNNRYVENILISIGDTLSPVDLSELHLGQMIRVFDNDNHTKDLPVSEKKITFKNEFQTVVVKLGLKKTLLTEIINIETKPKENVITQKGSGGQTIVQEEYQIWTGDTQPNSDEYQTWFNPIDGEEESLEELSVGEDNTEEYLMEV